MGALAVVASLFASAVLFASAALLASAPPAGASSASAAVLPSLTVQGFGFGHGRGMGQWGAFGYASEYHWSYQRILAHYYGGTRLGPVQQVGTEIPVLLSEAQGKALKVVAPPGEQLTAVLPGGGSVVGAALEVAWRAGAPSVYTGASCSGAWHQVAEGSALVGGTSAAATTTGPSASGGQDVSIVSTVQASGAAGSSHTGAGAAAGTGTGPAPAATTSTTGATVDGAASGLVDVCLPRLGAREYAGKVLAEPNGNVFDVLPLEQYVDGVVPAESPETWAAHGGEAALEAQAVAARSYALASLLSQGYVCDNTQCQMFLGVPDQYGPTADAAVAATAGQVLYCLPATTCGPAGSVALTEYSASTGGYTAGGAFPAVVDQGDAVAANPVHSWTFTLTAAQLAKAFPSLGGVTGASVTARNGLGAMGGRVVSVTVFGRNGQMA
ncbi:MAG TPA: SpoIID/LytB domain-containing protein, partial [Acidimicrobiales bacterium]|nr:SpoIID/LytB domain-containing protein [Acidimicrobiales bacterium]